MSETLGDRIRSEASIASRHGQYHSLMRIADEVDDTLMALVRVNLRLTDGGGGEATRAVGPPAAEPLIDTDDLAAASFVGPLAVMAYLREVLTPETLRTTDRAAIGTANGHDLHRRIFGEDK